MSRPAIYVLQLGPHGQEFVTMSRLDGRWFRCPNCGGLHDVHDPQDRCHPTPEDQRIGRIALALFFGALLTALAVIAFTR